MASKGLDRLKVAIVVRDSVGGICRYSHELAEALSVIGADVILICREDFPRFGAYTYRRDACLGGSRRRWQGSLGTIWSRLVLILESIYQPVIAFGVCRREDVKFIHFSNSFHLGFYFWRCFMPRRAYLGLSVHDVSRRSVGAVASLMDRQLKAVYAKAAALFVHDADTYGMLSVLLRREDLPVFVVPHGHFSYYRSDDVGSLVSRREGIKTGLFFGSIRDEKRLDLLMRALACRSRCCQWRLIVAGSSSGGQHRPLSFYRTLAVSLGIDRHIEFFDGYIPDEQVYQFFEVADWVGLVHDRSFTSQSGVLATAVDFAVPVLCCGAPLIDKTVRMYEIGHACEGDEPEVILAGIEELELKGMEEFRPGFERFLREMKWETNARITLEAYASLVSGSPKVAGERK